MKKALKKSPFFRLLGRHQKSAQSSSISRFSELRDFLRNYLLEDFEPKFLEFGEITDKNYNLNCFEVRICFSWHYFILILSLIFFEKDTDESDEDYIEINLHEVQSKNFFKLKLKF